MKLRNRKLRYWVGLWCVTFRVKLDHQKSIDFVYKLFYNILYLHTCLHISSEPWIKMIDFSVWKVDVLSTNLHILTSTFCHLYNWFIEKKNYSNLYLRTLVFVFNRFCSNKSKFSLKLSSIEHIIHYMSSNLNIIKSETISSVEYLMFIKKMLIQNEEKNIFISVNVSSDFMRPNVV